MGMKYLKMYENFKEEDIHEICKKYDIINYTINNGLVDVDGELYLADRYLTELPLKFGKVTGDFSCSYNKLSTLEGCPSEVGGYFYCSNNKLSTLEGCPSEVGGNFYCSYNKLSTLEGCPKEVGGYFNCDNNPVQVIYNLFTNHESFIDSLDYNYFRGGNKINKIRLTQALEEIGKKCPENIKGYVWE